MRLSLTDLFGVHPLRCFSKPCRAGRALKRGHQASSLSGAVLIFLLLPPAPWVMPSHAAGEPAALRERLEWLEHTTSNLIAGCKVRADNGAVLYTPDGH